MPPSRLRTSKPGIGQAPRPPPRTAPDPADADHGPVGRELGHAVGHQTHGHVYRLGRVAGRPLVVLPDVEEERAPVEKLAGGRTDRCPTTGPGSEVTASRYRNRSDAGCTRRVGAASPREVHQLDAHAVGVRAVEEVQAGPGQVEGGPGGRTPPCPRAPRWSRPGRRRRPPGARDGSGPAGSWVGGPRPRSWPGDSYPSSSMVTPSRASIRDSSCTPSTSMRAANSPPTSWVATGSKPRPSQ